MEEIEDLYWKYFLVFALLIMISETLAKFVHRTITNRKIRTILFELISSTEICMINYTFISVTKRFTPTIYILMLFITTFIWKSYWRSIDSSPNTILEYMLVHKNIRSYGIFIICAQILGDYISLKIFYLLLNIDDKKSIDCPKTFDEDYVVNAFMFEWLLTVIYRLSYYGLAHIKGYLSIIDVSILGTLVLTVCRSIGFFFIGSFNNPVIGAFLRYNCLGIEKYHILLVYWVAPFCGSLSALFMLYVWKQWRFYLDHRPTGKIRLTIHDISADNNSLYLQHTTEFKVEYPITVPFKPRTW